MSDVKAAVHGITVRLPGNLWLEYEVRLHNGVESICILSTPYKERAETLSDQINKLLRKGMDDERND